MSDNETVDFTLDSFEQDVDTPIEETPVVEDVVKTEEPPKEEVVEEVKDEEAAAEPKAEEDAYTPNFNYKVKDEEKEFPEFLKAIMTNKENEDAVRDLFTKADAMEGIKESRTAIETEFNDFKQDYDNKVVPYLNNVRDFDKAVEIGDYNKAFEMANIPHEKVIDSMLLDSKFSDMLYGKVLEQINAEEAGPQALDARRQAHNEQLNAGRLESKNSELQARIDNSERALYDQLLSISLEQNSDVVGNYEAARGAGSFEKLVRDMGHSQWINGNKMTAPETVKYTIDMLNLAPANTNTTAAPAPIATPKATPGIIPDIGTGTNVSMVSRGASTMADWEKNLQAS